MIKKISKNNYSDEFDFLKMYKFLKRNYKLIFSIIFITLSANIFFSKIKKTYSAEIILWVPSFTKIEGMSVGTVINRFTEKFGNKNILNTLLNQEKVFRDLYIIRNQEIEKLKINEKEILSLKKWSENNINFSFKNDGLLKVNYRDIDPLLIESFLKRTDIYLHYQYINYYVSLIESTKSILDKELNNKYDLISNKIEENNLIKKEYGFSEQEKYNIKAPIDFDNKKNQVDFIKNLIKLRENYREILSIEELSNEILRSKEYINAYKNKLIIELKDIKKIQKDIFNSPNDLEKYELSRSESSGQYFENIGIPSKESLDLIMLYRTQELENYLNKNYYNWKVNISTEQKNSLKRLIIFGILYGTTFGFIVAISKDIINKKLN